MLWRCWVISSNRIWMECLTKTLHALVLSPPELFFLPIFPVFLDVLWMLHMFFERGASVPDLPGLPIYVVFASFRCNANLIWPNFDQIKTQFHSIFDHFLTTFDWHGNIWSMQICIAQVPIKLASRNQLKQQITNKTWETNTSHPTPSRWHWTQKHQVDANLNARQPHRSHEQVLSLVVKCGWRKRFYHQKKSWQISCLRRSPIP